MTRQFENDVASQRNDAGLTEAEIMRRELQKALQECQDQLVKLEAALRDSKQEDRPAG